MDSGSFSEKETELWRGGVMCLPMVDWDPSQGCLTQGSRCPDVHVTVVPPSPKALLGDSRGFASLGVCPTRRKLLDPVGEDQAHGMPTQ